MEIGKLSKIIIAFAIIIAGLVMLLNGCSRQKNLSNRKNGKLPNLSILLGQNQKNVELHLNGKFIEEDVYDPKAVGINSRPWGTPTKKHIVYSLTDLNRLHKRPLAKIVNDNGYSLVDAALYNEVSTDPKSDAVVTIYYSPKGKVVGVMFRISRMAFGDIVGSETYSSALRAVGFFGNTKPVNPSVSQKKIEQITANLKNKNYWGFVNTKRGWIGYHLQVNHLAALLINSTNQAVEEKYDLGDIIVTVSPKLIDWQEPPRKNEGTISKPIGQSSISADEAPDANSGDTSIISSDGSSSVSLSQVAIDYAKKLGGKSHKGETLYLIIGATTNYETMSRQRLEEANPLFGDMQSYFIVQKSDNFDGLERGWFVVFEAYGNRVDAESNLDFARRGFDSGENSPYIKKVVVKTDNPIPVNYVDVNPKGK